MRSWSIDAVAVVIVERAGVAERVGRVRGEGLERRIDAIGRVGVREMKDREVGRLRVGRADEPQHLRHGALVGGAELLLRHAAQIRRRDQHVDARRGA